MSYFDDIFAEQLSVAIEDAERAAASILDGKEVFPGDHRWRTDAPCFLADAGRHYAVGLGLAISLLPSYLSDEQKEKIFWFASQLYQKRLLSKLRESE